MDTNGERAILFFFGVLPWLNVLAIGLLVLEGRRRRGEPLASVIGFEASGGAVLLSSAVLCLAFPSECYEGLLKLTSPLNPMVEMVPPLGMVAAMGIIMAALTLPQLIAALAGGAILGRYRIRIERREPPRVAP